MTTKSASAKPDFTDQAQGPSIDSNSCCGHCACHLHAEVPIDVKSLERKGPVIGFTAAGDCIDFVECEGPGHGPVRIEHPSDLDKNDEAGEYFRKATELQPDYALGWAGLSIYYGAGVIGGQMDPGEALAQEEATATKAVELDDSLPEAHLALGAAFFTHRWNWARADQEIARAIELNPRYAEAYHFRSKIYTALNRNEEAIEAEKKSQELDPFARPFAMTLAFFSVRQYDAAVSDARMRLETLPQNVTLHWALFEAYRRKGAEKEAVQELEKLVLLQGHKAAATGIQRQFEQGGYKAVVRGQASYYQQLSSEQYVSPVYRATLSAQLGRREETLALLDEGYRQHSPLLLWIQNDPAFDFLHADERYRSIINRVGLPPAY